MENPAQEIFNITKPLMPGDCVWFTIFFMCGADDQTQHFIELGRNSDKNNRENLKNTGTALETIALGESFARLRDKLTPKPLEQFTHIELTYDKGGKFKSVLGYGEPNWDVMPKAWPDDISAESYTYTKAWPNGMPDGMKSLLQDPRSLIGFD